MKYVVGIGDHIISSNREDSIVIHALSSCVAVIFYDPVELIGAMIHIALPQNANRSGKAKKTFYYADTGLKSIIEELEKKYFVTLKHIQIHVIGGSNSKNENDQFKIGERNLKEVRSILKNFNLHFVEDSTGGNMSRTVELEIETGKLTIKTQALDF
ncbi:chemotaxis protein CheD [Fusibacter bizertensis]